MICQNVLSSERGTYQSEILLVEVIVAADFEPIKLTVTYTVGFRLQGKTVKKLKKLRPLGSDWSKTLSVDCFSTNHSKLDFKTENY